MLTDSGLDFRLSTELTDCSLVGSGNNGCLYCCSRDCGAGEGCLVWSELTEAGIGTCEIDSLDVAVWFLSFSSFLFWCCSFAFSFCCCCACGCCCCGFEVVIPFCG